MSPRNHERECSAANCNRFQRNRRIKDRKKSNLGSLTIIGNGKAPARDSCDPIPGAALPRTAIKRAAAAAAAKTRVSHADNICVNLQTFPRPTQPLELPVPRHTTRYPVPVLGTTRCIQTQDSRSDANSQTASATKTFICFIHLSLGMKTGVQRPYCTSSH